MTKTVERGQSRKTATPSRREFSRFVERAEDKKEQMGILGKGDQCERSQNADRAVYEQREGIFAIGNEQISKVEGNQVRSRTSSEAESQA